MTLQGGQEGESVIGPPLSPAQKEILHSPMGEGMGLDRIGRFATMLGTVELIKETSGPLTFVEVGGGINLHGVAVTEQYFRAARHTAAEATSELSREIRSGDTIGGLRARLSDFFATQAQRDRVIRSFGTKNSEGTQMLTAVMSDLIVSPPDDITASKKPGARAVQLEREICDRFTITPAYKHIFETDMPADPNGFGAHEIAVARNFGGITIHEYITKVMGGDEVTAKRLMGMFAKYFSRQLCSPKTIRPFQVISLDTRDPDELASAALNVYPEWFQDTQTFKRALEFDGFREQEHPWDTAPIEGETVNQMLVKRTLPSEIGSQEDEQLSEFARLVPTVLAQEGFIAIVPAAILQQGESIRFSFGGNEIKIPADRLVGSWGELGWSIRQRLFKTPEVQLACTNPFESAIFSQSRYAMAADGSPTAALGMLSFRRPKRTLSERVSALKN